MQSQFEILDKQRRIYEEQPIISILKLLGIPEHKSGSMVCIPDFLEQDKIFICMPKSIYDSIDFSKLSIPKRLNFIRNIYDEAWRIVGANDFKPETLEIKFDNSDYFNSF